VKRIIPRLVVSALLAGLTVVAYGGAFHGWFLPKPFEKPVSLREGSTRTGSGARGLFFIGGRSHYGGGYRGGK
jgi:hypothetical protein